jgi:hypothetical protein
VRTERIVPGARPPARLAGAVLTRDLVVAEARWSKGRRLSTADLEALSTAPPAPAVTVLVPGPGDLHEDEAARRLAEAVRGAEPGLELRGPVDSRVDLVAAFPGVVRVRLADLERLNRHDPLEVFTVLDGRVVGRGDLVASVKVGPHLVSGTVVEAGERIARRHGPLVRVRAFRPLPIAVLVKETIVGPARERFEDTVRAKVAGLGARLVTIRYVVDRTEDVTEAMAAATRGPDRAAIILTAGGASTDPLDPFYVAVGRLGGRIVRHGVPAHPGSMVWLGRIRGTAVLGVPSCGAYSRATAVDVLLPWLVAGEPASAVTVARLGHGGILTRDQRFRFPPYARGLDAPDG